MYIFWELNMCVGLTLVMDHIKLKFFKFLQPSSQLAFWLHSVKKKDGNGHFLFDYCKVNSITHKDAYPQPRVDDLLDTYT